MATQSSVLVWRIPGTRDGRAWRAAIYGVSQSRTQQRRLSSSSSQYSCLENSMDRGAWKATVHGVTESHVTEWLTHAGDSSVTWGGQLTTFPTCIFVLYWSVISTGIKSGNKLNDGLVAPSYPAMPESHTKTQNTHHPCRPHPHPCRPPYPWRPSLKTSGSPSPDYPLLTWWTPTFEPQNLPPATFPSLLPRVTFVLTLTLEFAQLWTLVSGILQHHSWHLTSLIYFI